MSPSSSELPTKAEQAAEKAENLPAFRGIKLLHVRDEVAKVLSLIGRGGIFEQYTAHDISHIDKMLAMLDWLIPDDTARDLRPADWLLIVLSIYFHDLGMLVTTDEYTLRASSGYLEFRDKVLFAGEGGRDYQSKVEQLPAEEADRFVYQEFVRRHHASRIRDWVDPTATPNPAMAESVAEVRKLLAPLPATFRRDLGLVCESHHLDDLKDFTKYRVSQPYGDSDAETADVQYAALILRTADLLHMTSDRTPSVLFRLINPTDPLSQEAWARHRAVTRVRSKFGRNREGEPDENVPRDTIEVFAHFTSIDGFFGLTSYLNYCGQQLQLSFEWRQLAERSQAAVFRFPWRYIDDSNILTEGFLRETFEFTLDQTKILDLLTGHTLYNDTGVVLRELIQNAIDAVRLQEQLDLDSGAAASSGHVRVKWDSGNRQLTVEDDGTGMTQSVIERHLLKVGSSRYQDPEFIKEHPTFSAISRFGIGILSAFMVADDVEIWTCHQDEAQARQLSLRSVHGKYLVRLVDKRSAELDGIRPHGTRIQLRVRASAEIKDVADSARSWIVVPRCSVTAQVDEDGPQTIGFASVTEALEATLLANRFRTGRDLKVLERTVDGVSMAFAVRWDEYFDEWSFITMERDDEAIRAELGVCVEGIRVQFRTPGFERNTIYAIANATGPNAPKTTVARSGFESNAQFDRLLSSIYEIYSSHVGAEMESLYRDRGFSLTWAADSARYLVSPLSGSRYVRDSAIVTSQSLLEAETSKIPMLVIEHEGIRSATSATNLAKVPRLATIDAAVMRSSESLLREVRGESSVGSILQMLSGGRVSMPPDPILCDYRRGNPIEDAAFVGKEVDALTVYPEQRRVDLRWVQRTSPARWRSLEVPPDYLSLRRPGRISNEHGGMEVLVARNVIALNGLKANHSVQSQGTFYVPDATALAEFLNPVLDTIEGVGISKIPEGLFVLGELIKSLLGIGRGVRNGADYIESRIRRHEQNSSLSAPGIDAQLGTIVKLADLALLLERDVWRTFNPAAWKRNVDEERFSYILE